MARQRMGQHFLGDSGWRQRIFQTLPLNAGDVWVEIGSGHGEMTRLLAAENRQVIAIEADPLLAAGLRESVDKNPTGWPGIEVVARDILATDLSTLVSGRFRVYGNLPYYITSPILHRLFAWADRIASIHIVIQLEVAERIVARPECRDYGYLSVVCQFYAKPEIVLRLPPGAFKPPPKVTSALLQITLPGERQSLGVVRSDEEAFLRFVQKCFAQKRKTLRNNLRSILPPERIEKGLAALDIRADARAEQLSVAQFAELFSRLR